MDTADNKCIWAEQCGNECEGRCPDYSPIDETENDEEFYASILKENFEDYGEIVKEYSDEDGGEV